MRLFDYALFYGASEADWPFATTGALPPTPKELGRDIASRLGALLALKKGPHLRGVLYLSSNCNAASNRDSFVRILTSHMAGRALRVDSVGACLHNREVPDDLVADEFDPTTNRSFRTSWNPRFYPAQVKLTQRYLFRVVAPNSLCEDYVTEKLTVTLHAGSVPIYLGAPNGKLWDPGLATGVHPAMIHAADFDSAAALARHVARVAHNETLYRRHFEWWAHAADMTWPQHLPSLRAKREGTRNFEEYACLKLHTHAFAEGAGPLRRKHAHVPTNCAGTWEQYFAGLGKDLTKWRAKT